MNAAIPVPMLWELVRTLDTAAANLDAAASLVVEGLDAAEAVETFTACAQNCRAQAHAVRVLADATVTAAQRKRRGA